MSKPPLRAFALACVALSIHGCSADEPNSSRSRVVGPAAVAEPMGGSANDLGNADNPSGMTRPPPAASGTAGAGDAPMTPNTALTHEPIAIDQCGDNNPAGLPASEIQKLKAGRGSPAELRPLYPYDGTVFPRGMLAPDMMWEGPPADAVYVHIKSMIFEYWGCLKPNGPGRITLSQDAWDRAGERSAGKADFYTIELSVLSRGAVIGPVSWKIQIAQAAIKGSIFYNTYRSNLLGGAAAPGGAPAGFPGGFPGGIPGAGFGASNGIVVRIPAAGRAEVFGQTDCNGCHSVSADGSLLLAQSVQNGAYSYELVASGPAPAPKMAGPSATWAALYPDGSAFLTMSTVIDVARAGFFGGLGGGSTDATLFDAMTGQPIKSTGIPAGALMPAFAPDGTHLVFNDYAVGEAHGIALTRYDTATHTASDHAVIYQERPGAMRPAWPFMLPDNHGVVFVRTDDFDFTGGGVGVAAEIQPGDGARAPFSELSIIDVDTRTVTLLARAMGYNTPQDALQNVTYLPFGVDDLHHAYYPTVSPVAAGGYFWVFFDSIRNYGNLGLQRQLWGAAIDISADGDYAKDPSYPAFYVSGQESGTGNHRAFAALDPCRIDGDSCTSGIDCCGGYCYTSDPAGEFDETKGTCSPMKQTCSKRDERCTSDADCCPPIGNALPNSCIAGFCAYVPPVL
jgi:hypothetical protein